MLVPVNLNLNYLFIYFLQVPITKITNMRLSMRTLLVVLSTFIILSIVLFWSKCSNGEHETFSKLDNINYKVRFYVFVIYNYYVNTWLHC